MARNRESVELVDESTSYALGDVCERCGVQMELVIEFVEAGVITPAGSSPSQWRFGIQATNRIQKALRLRRDLDINIAGIAVALDIRDELDRALLQLRSLERRLAQLDSIS
ncbi:MAG: chaperone modulatory protein CbpM [Gammaproteobacteria bacterium]|jgi:chaperone modulatory protein CbpM